LSICTRNKKIIFSIVNQWILLSYNKSSAETGTYKNKKLLRLTAAMSLVYFTVFSHLTWKNSWTSYEYLAIQHGKQFRIFWLHILVNNHAILVDNVQITFPHHLLTFCFSIPKSEQVYFTNISYSTKLSGSHKRCTLSRAVSFPWKN
jgi:hypothetical protein